MLRLEAVEIVQDDWRLTADLALEAGSSTALIGPSGSGKSTLLSAIAGFVAPARGRILWDGRDITPLPPAERPLTLLFQEHNLFAHLTAAAERRPRPAARPAARPRRLGAGRGGAATPSASPASARAGPASSPAASASGWRWPARCCAPGRSCCSTSPSRRSARRSGPRCSTSSRASAPSRTRRWSSSPTPRRTPAASPARSVLVDGDRAHPAAADRGALRRPAAGAPRLSRRRLTPRGLVKARRESRAPARRSARPRPGRSPAARRR